MSETQSIMASTRLSCEKVMLQAISSTDVAKLARVGSGDIHADDYMPFGSPWTVGTAEQRTERLQRWYADRLREATRSRWTLIFSVHVDDRIVGSTNLYADGFQRQRTVSTGSWLLRDVQGQGIGTLMRQMLLNLAFSHLGAAFAASEAWEDNLPSRRVNEKCGYIVVDQYEKTRADGPATMMRYELTRRRWTMKSLDLPEIEVEIDPRLPSALG